VNRLAHFFLVPQLKANQRFWEYKAKELLHRPNEELLGDKVLENNSNQDEDEDGRRT
jgi:hypothetical protein